ncbi:transcriptional regulator [Azorhizobium oxalatiphilum]|uniref:Transcriptional regulator n=1 Tax=Azorhizobium oxalatiphilum TaxID=980631 RepID=A0A917FEU1_9HYPH|nr:DNA-binding transcriptional regulator [Azorhizobium oxalatiphilum]GGF72626.1 transcriptional regulator [Azorhizobium oxalatiphilum]
MPDTSGSPQEKSDGVRALRRGLAVLRHVNAVGSTGVADIARALDIPRPTVYRLLQTLEEEGYIAFSASSAQVRVTRLAASLGDSYVAHSRVCQAAGPIFGQYAPRLVWPLDLTVYDNAAMVIQETTHARSPLSIDRGMIGYRLPMLRTSAGRAYLGFCPPEERTAILDHLRRIDDPEDRPFLEEAWLSRILDQTRQRGIAARDGGEFRPRTNSIAVPVIIEARVEAVVSMIWIRAALSLDNAILAHGRTLCEVAAAVALACQGAEMDEKSNTEDRPSRPETR